MSLTTPDTIGRRIRFAQLRWKRLKASRERMSQRAAELARSFLEQLESHDRQEGKVMN